LIADIITANTRIVTPTISTGTTVNSVGNLSGQWRMAGGSSLNLSRFADDANSTSGDVQLFAANISTGQTAGGNILEGTIAGRWTATNPWTFDSKPTFNSGILIDNATSILQTTGANVNIFTANADIIKFGMAATSIQMGSKTGNSNIELRRDVLVGRNLYVETGILFNGTYANGDYTGIAVIANTGSNTVYFGGEATAISVGNTSGNTTINHNLIVTGDAQVNGGDLTTTATTFNALNANATTINLGGAATTLSVGASTGNTTINHNLIVTGDAQVNGGDLTTTATTFNLLNANTTTLNIGAAATQINLGVSTGRANVNSNTLSVYNNNDGQVLIGGDTNGGIEIGLSGRSSTGVPFIDFHSSTTGSDYDVRLVASGGNSTAGSGNLSINAAILTITGGQINNLTAINPDGDGVAIRYNDNNPTINSYTHGGGWSIGADGDTLQGWTQSKSINADGGMINSSGGYYVGTLDFGADSASHTTTKVIDGSGAVFATSLSIGGPTSTPSTGELYATGNIIAFSASDESLKTNIVDISGALPMVRAIGGQTFEWTDEALSGKEIDGYLVRKEDFGHVAQRVLTQFPLAVRKRPDGILTIDYEKLSALSFAAIDELAEQVDELKVMVQTLIDKLENK
jgi:hypothetical protein